MSFRKISKDKYIIAGVITALIFILGLTLGTILEGYRNNYIENVNKDQENNYRSLQLQYLYLDYLKDDNQISCLILQSNLEKSLEDLSDSLSEFLEYEEDSKLNKDEFKIAGRRYLLDNLRYWFFAQEATRMCNLDVLPILYFYSEDCKDCPTQGTILTYYRRIFDKRVLVFPLNSHFREDEPLLDILTSKYNVTQYPTLIIHDQKYQGLVSKEDLGEIVCTYLYDETICS